MTSGLAAGLGILSTFLLAGMAVAQGKIAGSVVGEDGAGLPYANVKVSRPDDGDGLPFGEVTDLEGRFSIELPEGQYALDVSMVGFHVERLEVVEVRSDETTSIRVVLREKLLELSAITVTPGRFAIMQTDPTVKQTLTREDIESIPQIGEDVYRAVMRLPGISSNDFSAKFTVRGGEHEEVLVSMDGLELFDPFHLKDISMAAD